MNLQWKILSEKLKKNWLWFLILILISLLNLILYSIRPAEIMISKEDLFALICYPSLRNSDFISMLLAIYQIILLIYITYIFYFHEFEYSSENIILRVNQKKWIINKILVISIFIIIFKTFHFLLIYLYFYNKILFEFNFILYPMIYSLLIVVIFIFCLNFWGKKKYLIYLCSLFFLYQISQQFNFIASVIGIILVVFFIFYNFNFKKYCYFKEKK